MECTQWSTFPIPCSIIFTISWYNCKQSLTLNRVLSENNYWIEYEAEIRVWFTTLQQQSHLTTTKDKPCTVPLPPEKILGATWNKKNYTLSQKSPERIFIEPQRKQSPFSEAQSGARTSSATGVKIIKKLTLRPATLGDKRDKYSNKFRQRLQSANRRVARVTTAEEDRQMMYGGECLDYSPLPHPLSVCGESKFSSFTGTFGWFILPNKAGVYLAQFIWHWAQTEGYWCT